ncbi:MAG: TetR/AcrR family transcriptional regulator [Chloroflexota bacterium]
MSKYNPDLKRQKILEATRRILREGGYFTKFSLEQVARAAGVSKGGLLHHFPDKKALLQAAIQDIVTQFEARLVEATNDEEPDEGQFTRAYIRAGLQTEPSHSSEVSPILLAFLRSSNTAESVDTRFNYWHKKTTEDGLDMVMATIIRLAVDGLLYTESIDAEAIDAQLREQIVERLLDLATS